jgi:hypothetical protein
MERSSDVGATPSVSHGGVPGVVVPATTDMSGMLMNRIVLFVPLTKSASPEVAGEKMRQRRPEKFLQTLVDESDNGLVEVRQSG